MGSYEYKRFMRDGSVSRIVAVVRSKRANAKPRLKKKGPKRDA